MNKTDLIKDVVARLEGKYTEQAVNDIISAALDAMSNALQKGEGVKLKGFGVFQVVTRSARTVTPPGKDKPITIPPRKAVKFQVSSTLKSKVESA